MTKQKERELVEDFKDLQYQLRVNNIGFIVSSGKTVASLVVKKSDVEKAEKLRNHELSEKDVNGEYLCQIIGR